MGSPSLGNHLSWAYVPRSIFPSGRDFEITAFRRRLRRSLGPTRKEEEMEIVSKTKKGKGKVFFKKGDS